MALDKGPQELSSGISCTRGAGGGGTARSWFACTQITISWVLLGRHCDGSHPSLEEASQIGGSRSPSSIAPYNTSGRRQACSHGTAMPMPWGCMLTLCLRMQEDPWNAIGAGALTGGFLQLRSGFKSAAKSAAFGGILLVRTVSRNFTLMRSTSQCSPSAVPTGWQTQLHASAAHCTNLPAAKPIAYISSTPAPADSHPACL